MLQSRKQSLIEAGVNTVIGLAVSFTANVLVLPHYGVHGGLRASAEITAIFTVISVARQYALRRWFNARLKALAERLSKGHS